MKMNYWYFTKVSKNILHLDKPSFQFESRRNFNGKENDKVVFLTQSELGLIFSHHAEIDFIKKKKIDPSGKFNYIIHFKNIEGLNAENLLVNYLYSLIKIKNFTNPYSHFKTSYGRLKQVEFDAITNEEFYVARTMFGKYLNALPKQHKIAFIEYFISENPVLFFSVNKNFNVALKHLENYIEYRITQPAIYLKKAYLLMSNLVSEEEIGEIRFSVGEKPIDSFDVQFKYCNEYLNLRDAQNTNIDFPASNFNDLQEEFDELFKKSAWPIINN